MNRVIFRKSIIVMSALMIMSVMFFTTCISVMAASTDWNLVATPEITGVTQDSAGNLKITFKAVINSDKGADEVRIIMLQDGYPVNEKMVTSQTTSVTFTPLKSGDYSFRIIARRAGEADKEGAVYNYKGYVLAIKKPVIELARNMGNGTLYLDWINLQDADTYKVEYKLSSASSYTTAASNLTKGEYTLTGLSVGNWYDVRITAKRNSDGYTSTYSKNDIVITQDAEQIWYVGNAGSAKNSEVAVLENGTVVNAYSLPENKSSVKQAVTVPNTDRVMTMQGSTSGKISDGEDGFTYYYTMIDPDTENFSLKATFTITDASLVPDNQTGFGLIATDMLGINYWGNASNSYRYFNSVSTIHYGAEGLFVGQRNVTGYFSEDTSNYANAQRISEQQAFKNVKGDFTVGKQYTLELNKTDEGYESVCNGEVINNLSPAILSVQEDGSICVGIMVSRKISVAVSDVVFSTSESAGVGTTDEEDEKVVPKLRVYSSDTTGSSQYEYIVHSNVAGDINITASERIVMAKSVTAGEVVKLVVNVPIGKTTIKAVLTPTKGQNITSTNAVNTSVTVTHKMYGEEGGMLVISPNGTSAGDGTKESPLDIYTAVKYAQPGQILYLLNGTYSGSDVIINRSVCGTQENNIVMVAETLGGVIFEGTNLTIVGDYWHVYGIYVRHTTDVGILLCGNYNTIEMCTVEGAGDSGIQISRYGSADADIGMKYLLWPSYNLVKNCDSFDNCDPGLNDADGFAAKLTCGVGNKFYGCIAHHNVDDGWDLFAKTHLGEIGAVTIENCVAYNNGWLTYDSSKNGDGNGFKLGGSNMKGNHILKNSISYNNATGGITSNGCPDCNVYNCTTFNNSVRKSGSTNLGLFTSDLNVKAWDVDGVISISTNNSASDDNVPYHLSSNTNYLYRGTASYNIKGVSAESAWFVDTDTDVCPTRNADGTINMHGLLTLNEQAPQDSGARLDVTSDEAKSVYPIAVGGTLKFVEDQWRYYENNLWVADKYGFVEYDGARFLVANGVVASNVSGLCLYDDKWYFLADGMWQKSFSGLALYDGEWFLVKNGMLDSYSGIYSYDNSLFLISDGRIRYDYSGLFMDTDETWYFLANGQVQTTYTGLALYDNVWFYIKNGIFLPDYSGWVVHDGVAFEVYQGSVIV